MVVKSKLRDLVKNLPQKPGVYQFYNSNEEILYIGKAKNLKKRVRSYFLSETRSYKQEALVKKIENIRYILVESESDALLLENNLIKEYKPRYNILLKDDKTFPWISIKKENYPRVMLTRNYIPDGSEYYGPYTSALMAKTLLELIRQLYKLRTCNLILSEEDIKKGKFRRCLEYHIGNCNGPCEGLQTKESYNQSILQIKEILKGNYHQVIQHLHKLMEDLVGQLMFEGAEVVKQRIEILEKFKGKSTIVNPKISNVDVIYLVDDEDYAYINFFKIVNGAIVQAHNIEITKKLQEDKLDLLSYIIFDLRNRFKSNAKEVIVPFKPSMLIPKVKFTIPEKGDRKKLLDLSKRNATSFRIDKLVIRENTKWPDEEKNVLIKLKSDLKLIKVPTLIECFDISNIQGSNQVASCVVYKEAKPFKSSYRHFNIKTVKGPNDYASIEEVIARKYKRVINENAPLPDLIIIDGGKGQLRSASNSLKKLNIYNQVAIISIAKRLEEIYVPDDPIPLYLDKNSTSLRLIQRIRNEAHRFGIAFHRKKRSGSQTLSYLRSIPGIGEKSIEKILRCAPDVDALKLMDLKNLMELTDKRTGKILFNYFSLTKNNLSD
ncbi:MAG TPA: excinuclease ABC subunit UvrC [Candidatus Nanoarchaeia archaeon]|nr:excinuclease ABC subunit UvrC [Candidatus Nanoarchaeia archaeon]